MAVHPADDSGAELYLMCDDLAAETRLLAERGVQCTDLVEERWGTVTKIRLPSGGEVGLYQPTPSDRVGPPDRIVPVTTGPRRRISEARLREPGRP